MGYTIVHKQKAGFTLFELMVVVLIIGIVYSIVLGQFDPKQRVEIVKLQTLKNSLLSHWQEGKRIDLILYDKCTKSALFKNGTYQEDMNINLKPAMFKDITIYKNDAFDHEREIIFSPIIIEDKIEPVCFVFSIFPNGGSSSYIIAQKGKYYIFYPYFEDVNITDTLEDALEQFTHQKYKKISSYE